MISVFILHNNQLHDNITLTEGTDVTWSPQSTNVRSIKHQMRDKFLEVVYFHLQEICPSNMNLQILSLSEFVQLNVGTFYSTSLDHATINEYVNIHVLPLNANIDTTGCLKVSILQ